jgi:hypothetical protein
MRPEQLKYFIPSLLILGLLVFVAVNPKISYLMALVILTVLVFTTTVWAARRIQREKSANYEKNQLVKSRN